MLTYWQGTSRQGIGVGEFVVARPVLPRDHARSARPTASAPTCTSSSSRRGTRRSHQPIRSCARTCRSSRGRAGRRRLRDPGDRHRHGARGLRVALARPDPARARPSPLPTRAAGPVGLHARELGRPRQPTATSSMSARNTWAVYKIDREHRQDRWRLGGKRSNFRLGRGVRFAWQHDAHRRADGASRCSTTPPPRPSRKRSRALALAARRAAPGRRRWSARVTHPRGC